MNLTLREWNGYAGCVQAAMDFVAQVAVNAAGASRAVEFDPAGPAAIR